MSIVWKEIDEHKRSPTRCDVYIEARKQPKIGQPHPKVAETCKKLKDFCSGEGSSDDTSLEDDALTQVLGKNTRGMTRGVGRVCKGKVKAVKPLKADIEQYKNDHQELKSIVLGIQSKMDCLIQPISHNFLHNQVLVLSPPPPPPPLFPSTQPPLSTPSATRNRGKTLVLVKDVTFNNVIAKGYIIPTCVGEIVHGRKMLGHELKVEIISVEKNFENVILYLGGNSFVKMIGDVDGGGFMVWPTCFLDEITE